VKGWRVPGSCGETGIGWPGPHHCHRCCVSVWVGCWTFLLDVARGHYDAAGYTQAERKAQAKAHGWTVPRWELRLTAPPEW